MPSFPTTKLHLTVGELKWKRGDVNIGTNGTHAWADLICLTGQPWVENFDGRWGAHILFGTGPKPGGFARRPALGWSGPGTRPVGESRAMGRSGLVSEMSD